MRIIMSGLFVAGLVAISLTLSASQQPAWADRCVAGPDGTQFCFPDPPPPPPPPQPSTGTVTTPATPPPR